MQDLLAEAVQAEYGWMIYQSNEEVDFHFTLHRVSLALTSCIHQLHNQEAQVPPSCVC
jgi:hypothetical protein